MEHQIEHQTGLILPNSPKKSDLNVIASGTTLQPSILKVLRILRDSNPSLQRKMMHGIDDTQDSSVDQYLSYWNRFQEMVILSNDTFTGLNLGGLMVRLVNVIPFFQAIEEENINLQKLNLGGTDIGMDNFLQAVESLSDEKKTCVTGLYLGGCGIASRKGTGNLIKALGMLPNLNILDLRYNDFEGKDMVDLESSIASAATLEILHLEGNFIKCEGATAIGNVLKTSNIKELYLGANQIGSVGAKALADGITNNGHLEKLYLEGNFIGEIGANAFKDVLLDQQSRECKVLGKLYFDNNGIGKEAATSLGRALGSEGLIDGSLFGD